MSARSTRVRVCFVCLGNICRSPTAEGVMRKLVDDAGLREVIAIESAGTGDWHVGETADPRTYETALARGIDLQHRAKQFQAKHFASFDHVLAMDRSNLRALRGLASEVQETKKIALLRSFDPESPLDAEVPDPYYGGPGGFDRVFDICEAACKGLLEHLRQTHGL